MTTSAIAGIALTPAALADEKGNVLIMAAAANMHWVERLLRSACTEMGCTAGLASSPMTGTTAKQVARGMTGNTGIEFICGPVSLADGPYMWSAFQSSSLSFANQSCTLLWEVYWPA